MNNLSYISQLNQAATQHLLATPDTASPILGTQTKEYDLRSSTEHNQEAVPRITREIQHTEESLFSTYQPVNQGSIPPVHHLLF